MQFAWKSIRDRVNLLIKNHTKKLAESAGSSGVCESYSVKVKLLEEVIDLKEAGAGEKDLQKEAKEKLEELGKAKREQAMQNRRKKIEAEADEEGDGEAKTPPKKRKTMVDVIDRAITAKFQTEREIAMKRIAEDSGLRRIELSLKERELALREKEFELSANAPRYGA
jgi:hypothetical protein